MKGVNAIVTSRSNFLGVKKQAFCRKLSHNLEPKVRVRHLVNAVVSEETGIKPEKQC